MRLFKVTYRFPKKKTIVKFVSGDYQREVFHNACIEAHSFEESCIGIEVVLHSTSHDQG